MKTITKIVVLVFGLSLAGMVYAEDLHDSSETLPPGVNPIFRDAFTSDPAPLVVGDTLYVYTGSDIRDENDQWVMPAWRLYSTTDMIHWTSHGVILKPTDFKWGLRDAWAATPYAQATIRLHLSCWIYVTVWVSWPWTRPSTNG